MSFQEIRKWLQRVLGNYQYQDRVFQDVDNCLREFTTLMPRTDHYTYDDGRSELLLHLYGTLSINFRKTAYNIPFAIWIPREYPFVPPIAFVTPTATMNVRAGQHVDVNGRIYHPYLAYWHEHAEAYQIAEFLTILQGVFSKEPPVFAKPRSPPVTSAGSSSHRPHDNLRTSHSPSPPPPRPPALPSAYASPPPLPSRAHAQSPSNNYATSQYDMTSILSSGNPAILEQPKQPPPPLSKNPETLKLQLQVFDRIQARMNNFVPAATKEIDALRATSQQLVGNEHRLNEEFAVLQDVKGRCIRNKEILTERIQQVKQLIEETKASQDVPTDEMVCGLTVVHNQLRDLVADDNAIEDTIYYLGKALNAGRLDLNTFMRLIRSLAEEQFRCRALVHRIRQQAGLA